MVVKVELSFCDLRAKEVINICDGRRLGNVIDLVFDCYCARITGIVVPYEKGFFNFFRSHQDIFIPWSRIIKIGKDVILVELTPQSLPFPCPANVYTTEQNYDQKDIPNGTKISDLNSNTYIKNKNNN